MNNIPFRQKKDSDKERTASPEEIQESIYPYQQELDIADGGEFLDDALRMKDQPLGETMVKENE